MTNYAIKAAEAIQKLIVHCEAQEYKLAGELDLTRTESRILKQFNYHKSLNAVELTEMLCVTKSRIAFLVKSLLGKGLLERKQDQKDRRYQNVFLSDSGRKILDKINKQIVELCARDFAQFDKNELDQFIRLINKFLHIK